MKEVAPKLILLFRDPEGFGAAIYDALQPIPSSSLLKSEEKFELSLEQYGIKDQKARGNLANFTDEKGLMQHLLTSNLANLESRSLIQLAVRSLYSVTIYNLPILVFKSAKLMKNGVSKSSGQLGSNLILRCETYFKVSLLLVECYEAPILSCVINEVLRSIRGASLSSTVILTLPCILSAAQLKCDDKVSSVNNKFSLLGMHIGPVTDFTEDIVRTAEKPPLSLQIHYEPLACILQFAHCLNFPTALLIGKRSLMGEEEGLLQLGEHLASAFTLCFERKQIKLNIGESTKREEPWRALYG